jgi:hypothetical protein
MTSGNGDGRRRCLAGLVQEHPVTMRQKTKQIQASAEQQNGMAVDVPRSSVLGNVLLGPYETRIDGTCSFAQSSIQLEKMFQSISSQDFPLQRKRRREEMRA